MRRTAYERYTDQYLAHKNTLTNNLLTSVKQNVLQMRARRYNSTLEMALFDNAIPVEVFHNLLETFRKHLPVWHRYWAVRRKALGVETLQPYDIWAPLVPQPAAVSYQQAVDWICEALAPLGQDYVDAVRRGCLEQRWVDVYPSQGKTSGAFSSGSAGHLPLHHDELHRRHQQPGHAGPRAGPLHALLPGLADPAAGLQRLLASLRPRWPPTSIRP